MYASKRSNTAPWSSRTTYPWFFISSEGIPSPTFNQPSRDVRTAEFLLSLISFGQSRGSHANFSMVFTFSGANNLAATLLVTLNEPSNERRDTSWVPKRRSNTPNTAINSTEPVPITWLMISPQFLSSDPNPCTKPGIESTTEQNNRTAIGTNLLSTTTWQPLWPAGLHTSSGGNGGSLWGSHNIGWSGWISSI